MSRDLYQQRMLELAAAADEPQPLDEPDASATLDNPLCGDRVRIDLRCHADGRVAAIAPAVRGCVLCRAAAALVARHGPGRDQDELRTLRGQLQAGLRGEGALPTAGDWPELEIFQPVAAHKSRHECVLLPFDALVAALEQARPTSGTG